MKMKMKMKVKIKVKIKMRMEKTDMRAVDPRLGSTTPHYLQRNRAPGAYSQVTPRVHPCGRSLLREETLQRQQSHRWLQYHVRLPHLE